MSLIAKLVRERQERIANRDEAAIHRFEVVFEKLKSNDDLSDLRHYGAKIAHGDANDTGVLRKMEFSKNGDTVLFVVRDNGQTFIDGEDIGDLDADATHEKLCATIVDKLLV